MFISLFEFHSFVFDVDDSKNNVEKIVTNF
jgi:hypothetical protein